MAIWKPTIHPPMVNVHGNPAMDNLREAAERRGTALQEAERSQLHTAVFTPKCSNATVYCKEKRKNIK